MNDYMNAKEKSSRLSGNSSTQHLLALLRIALRGFFVAGEWPEGECRWAEVLRLAEEQTVQGVALEGVALLPAELCPPAEVKLRWIAGAQRIAARNREVDRAAVAVSRWFGKRGLRGCVLKGQGNALAYPWPERRVPGDVDIWLRVNSLCPTTEAGASDSMRAVLRLARECGVRGHLCYHHIEWRGYGDVSVEAHYRPSFLFSPVANGRLQGWFESVAEEQFGNMTELPGGAGRIAMPTAGFNAVYQLCHLQQHLLNEGVGLRQVVDYYMVLRAIASGGATGRPGWAVRDGVSLAVRAGVAIPAALRRFAGALMWVLVEALGMPREWTVAEPDARRGRLLLDEIMAGGNFGKFDSRAMSGVQSSALRHNIARVARDIRLLRYFPADCLWEPVFRVWHWWWRRKAGRLLRS